MLTALMVSMVVNCMPYRPMPPPPRPVVVRCEGADQVRRDHFGHELSRVRGACLPPVRLTTQPGWKFGLSGRG